MRSSAQPKKTSQQKVKEHRERQLRAQGIASECSFGSTMSFRERNGECATSCLSGGQRSSG